MCFVELDSEGEEFLLKFTCKDVEAVDFVSVGAEMWRGDVLE